MLGSYTFIQSLVKDLLNFQDSKSIKAKLQLPLFFSIVLWFPMELFNRLAGGLLSHFGSRHGVRIIDHCVTNNETDRTHITYPVSAGLIALNRNE